MIPEWRCRSQKWYLLCLFWRLPGLVGYTMRDIRYKWNSGVKSVGISNEVELPQFRVLGHRQRQTVINLSTGNSLARRWAKLSPSSVSSGWYWRTHFGSIQLFTFPEHFLIPSLGGKYRIWDNYTLRFLPFMAPRYRKTKSRVSVDLSIDMLYVCHRSRKGVKWELKLLKFQKKTDIFTVFGFLTSALLNIK